jgi:hypothetical protein
MRRPAARDDADQLLPSRGVRPLTGSPTRRPAVVEYVDDPQSTSDGRATTLASQGVLLLAGIVDREVDLPHVAGVPMPRSQRPSILLPSAEISPMKRWLKPGPWGPFQSSPGARQIFQVEASRAIMYSRLTPRESK